MSILFIVESTNPLDRLTADLEQAVSRHKFGVLGVHNLKETMAKKGVPFQRECRIFEVCNPNQAMIKPTAMIALYPNPELKGVAQEVEATLEAIMTEAAR